MYIGCLRDNLRNYSDMCGNFSKTPQTLLGIWPRKGWHL